MKIISLAPSNTEIIYALDRQEELIANTSMCDYPPEAKELPKVGSWLKVNIDQIKKMKPDLVLTSTFLQADIVKQLEENHIRYYHANPYTLEDVYQSINEIGILIGRERGARTIVAHMRKQFRHIYVDLSPPVRKKVYCEEWHKPPMVSGNWVPKVIRYAGSLTLCKEGKPSFEVTAKDVRKFNPDAIIISWCGFAQRAKLSYLSRRKEWQEIPAVQQQKIFVVDDSLLNRPGPRLVEGALQVAKILTNL